MKNIIAILLIITFGNSKATAQITQIIQAVKPQKAFEGTPILDKKDFVFSVGFGVPNNTTQLLSGGGVVNTILGGNKSNKSGFGPIFANVEYFTNKEFSLGLSASYANGKQDYSTGISIPVLGIGNTSIGTASINLFQIAATSSYHLYTTDKLDPYVKGAIGINIWKTNYSSGGNDSNPFTAPTPFGYQGLVGLRYFVSKNIAPYGELGYSSLKFTANIGLSVKM